MKTTIKDIQKDYQSKIDRLDLELLIAHVTKKTREFVLSHPEFSMTKNYQIKIANLIERRMKNEPFAYLVGQKEFFGLDFKVTPATLIPRPETELMVEEAISEMRHVTSDKVVMVDVGTGSGNIIISVAKATEMHMFQSSDFKFYGIDLSKEALAVARKNAKRNGVAAKIKFLHGNLLEPVLKVTSSKRQGTRYIILANLPYLSKEIYSATHPTVKKFEPKSALFSPKEGLDHYEKLLKQIKTLKLQGAGCRLQVTGYLEISPEQKRKISPLIKKYFSKAEIEFKKDLSGKWRLCKINL